MKRGTRPTQKAIADALGLHQAQVSQFQRLESDAMPRESLDEAIMWYQRTQSPEGKALREAAARAAEELRIAAERQREQQAQQEEARRQAELYRIATASTDELLDEVAASGVGAILIGLDIRKHRYERSLLRVHGGKATVIALREMLVELMHTPNPVSLSFRPIQPTVQMLELNERWFAGAGIVMDDNAAIRVVRRNDLLYFKFFADQIKEKLDLLFRDDSGPAYYFEAGQKP